MGVMKNFKKWEGSPDVGELLPSVVFDVASRASHPIRLQDSLIILISVRNQTIS